MRNIKFLISYNGTNYFGFQWQPNLPTIEGTICQTMEKIVGEEIKICGCSRTDTGVHAREYCFNVKLQNTIPENNLMRAMNALLPHDIAVLEVTKADDDFHARFDTKGKEYLYIINNSGVRNVFMSGQVLDYPYDIDTERLNSCGQIFIGEHDFGAFCKAESRKLLKSTIRRVTDVKVIRKDKNVEFYISGTGFLHNMVRIMVGTLVYVNEGKCNESDIKKALETGERGLLGKTLPPCGLYLNKVFY